MCYPQHRSYVVSNMYYFFSLENKGCFEECLVHTVKVNGVQTILNPTNFHRINQKSKYLLQITLSFSNMFFWHNLIDHKGTVSKALTLDLMYVPVCKLG